MLNTRQQSKYFWFCVAVKWSDNYILVLPLFEMRNSMANSQRMLFDLLPVSLPSGQRVKTEDEVI